VSGILTEWITHLETETREKVNFLRTDGGGEYMEEEFQRWLKSKRIDTNFIWSYLYQIFDDSHGLKASLKPLRRPFD